MKAIDYFLQLTRIPRPSGKEDKVVEFLKDYAIKNDLEYQINGNKNIIITKNNNSPKSIILQAHTDMVCEKHSYVDIDFNTDSIQTIIDGDIIKAKGTTLGADDGYGVATILQILDECGKGYPNIEAIFTSDEEVGMTGAMSLDLSNVKSNMVIGLDGTSSSEITVSSAGALRIQYDADFQTQKVNTSGYKVEVSGLLGGHSGEEINLNRANSNKLIFEFLGTLNDVTISTINGGNKDNAIPREAQCEFVTTDNAVAQKLKDFLAKAKSIYSSEKDLDIKLEKVKLEKLMDKEFSNKLLGFGLEFKNAVLVWDTLDSTFPITSINLASFTTKENSLVVRTMLRSSDSMLENFYEKKYLDLGKKYGFVGSIANRSPYFEKSKDGKLINACVNAYKNIGYDDLKVSGIHAGLEGGVFADKIKNAQIVCLGADLNQIHTPNESMKISSLEKLTKWIKEILMLI
ncbi:MAG: beta-Ala-His dipeptidase [Clostridia bacterium]|nr:beta-Ala-His dipeptidase [Clostridia bacterium]